MLPLRAGPSGLEPDHAVLQRRGARLLHRWGLPRALLRRVDGVREGLRVDDVVRIHESPAPRGHDRRGPPPRLLLCRLPEPLLQPPPGLPPDPSDLAGDLDALPRRILVPVPSEDHST